MDLHSLIVHFPIALIIAGTGFDVVGIVARADSALRTGYILLVVGAASAVAAALTGEDAAELTSRIPGITEDLTWHENLGTATAWVAVLLLLLRTRVLLKRRFVGATRGVYLLVAVGLAALAATSGYTGGRLVHRYGAGTLPVSERIQIESSPKLPSPQRGLP